MPAKLPPVKLDPPGRGRIYESIIDTIGNTPLIRVRRFAAEEGVVADLLLDIHRESETILIVVTHSSELAARFPQRFELKNQRLEAV